MSLSSAYAGRAFAAALALSWVCGGAQAGPKLTPHRAVYDLSMAESATDAGFTGADGRLVVELDDACDDWASSERMVLRLNSSDGSQSVFDYRFSALEAKDGGAFRFTTTTTANGREVERREGRVASAGDGARTVTFQTPDLPDQTLSADVRFPGDQLSRLLDAASGGDRAFEGLLFEGVSEAVVSLSAAAISPLGADPAPLKELEGLGRWRVSVAHFDPDAPEGRPDYEISFDLYENGVAARMRMVYDDFTLAARLAQVSIREGCAN